MLICLCICLSIHLNLGSNCSKFLEFKGKIFGGMQYFPDVVGNCWSVVIIKQQSNGSFFIVAK